MEIKQRMNKSQYIWIPILFAPRHGTPKFVFDIKIDYASNSKLSETLTLVIDSQKLGTNSLEARFIII